MQDYKPLSGRWHNRLLNSARLTARDVWAIRRRVAAGATPADMGSAYRVSTRTVVEIVTRQSWARLPPEPVYWRSEPSAFCSWWLTLWIFLSLCQHANHPPLTKGLVHGCVV